MKNPHPGQRICVDMDEVIADAVAEHLLRYNRDHAAALTKADLLGKRFWQVVPTPHHALLDDYLRADDFFAVLDVMPDAPRVLAVLQQRYEVFIASAAMEVPTSFNAKFDWLARHFPFIPPTTSSSAETSPSSAPTISSTTTPTSSHASSPSTSRVVRPISRIARHLSWIDRPLG